MRLGVTKNDRLVVQRGDEVVDATELAPGGGRGTGGPLHALVDAGWEPREWSADVLAPLPVVPAAELVWKSPIPRPTKVIGAPANYREHVAEMAATSTIAEWGVFLKATSSLIGDGDLIKLPYTDKRTDHEGELALIIGKTARHVGVGEALDHVFGYTCSLDITVRSSEDRSTRKSFDTFTPLGPWVTTADEIADPGDLELRCWVNGELRQSASTKELIFGVPELIAYASSVMTLLPGDVILTGTPAGVGPIVDGDEVTVEVERVGSMTVGVSALGATPYDKRPGA
jgi:2-keto-4-pentenoate hydratase/2-oxohepta-3-ene-1,7-dioic acid hydratase in catechol pathway